MVEMAPDPETSTTITKETTGFFSLPRELLETIYKLVLRAPQNILLRRKLDVSNRNPSFATDDAFPVVVLPYSTSAKTPAPLLSDTASSHSRGSATVCTSISMSMWLPWSTPPPSSTLPDQSSPTARFLPSRMELKPSLFASIFEQFVSLVIT